MVERADNVPVASVIKLYFAQRTPTGKLPAIEDGGVVMCEPGAIVGHFIAIPPQTTYIPPRARAGQAIAAG